MQFISISIINGDKYPTFHLTVPVLSQDNIILRVQKFLNKKNEKRDEGKKKKMSECRKLFQKNNCELFAFPNRQSDLNALASGELFLCSFFQNTGVVLCFFPLINDYTHRQTDVATSIFNGQNYPEFNDPFTAFLSPLNISFLICEEGSINTNAANDCTLSGVQFMVLKHKRVRHTLLCKKTDNRKVVESSILVKEMKFAHQTNEKYIFINCLSEEEGFDILLKFPILTEQAVKENIFHAQSLRSKSLNTTCLNAETDICQSTIFQTSIDCHSLFFLPIEICLNLPFNGLTGGKVYFSYKEDDKSFRVTVWSDFFESGYNPTFGYTRACSSWQVNRLSEYFLKHLLHKKIFIFQDPNIKLVQIGDFQYLLKNAKMQFVFQDRSLGLFFFRTKEQDQSDQSGETGSSSSSMQSSALQTATWTTNPQTGTSQCSMNMPYTQSSPDPQPSLLQTSSWTTSPQANSPQSAMGISCTQPDRQTGNPPHASMQIPSFYTEELPAQETLDSSQLTLEDVDQISAKDWEKLNIILQNVSTDALYTEELPAQETLDSSQLTLEDVDQISAKDWEKLNIILQNVSTDALYTEELPAQKTLDSSQLTLEDVNQISAENWEKLNIILQNISTDALLESLKDAKNG